MRFFWLALMCTGCAFISDKHEAWRLDPDGDGVDIRSDCDDDDGALGLPIEWYLDQDEDGFGAEADMKRQCTQPDGYVQNAEDCDDTNPEISPLAEEQCDLIDNDCDLQVDEDVNTMLAYTDGDGDGFGDPTSEQLVCMLADDQVLNGDDCDDENPDWQVEQPVEVFYNGVDDNCSDADLDGDQDGDGFWALDYADRVMANGGEPIDVAPEAQGDCIDDDAETHPGALDEPYDGRDQDCKGEDDYDQDRDGYVPEEYLGLPTAGVDGSGLLPGGDCNDYVENVRPDLVEDCSTPHDDDCDGSTNGVDVRGCTQYFEDYDRDGFGGSESRCQCEADFVYAVTNSTDCNDIDGDTYPGAFDLPYDGRDADCANNDDFDRDKDGYVPDEHVGKVTEYADGEYVDGTGMLRGGDCDDSDGSVNPDGAESCLTEADDDCDGSNNAPDAEGCSLFHLDADGDGFGHPSLTLCACAPYRAYRTTDFRDCDDDDPSAHPGADDAPYDAIDSDCAGDDDFDHDGDGFAKRGHEGEETLRGGSVVTGTGALPATDCDDGDESIHPDADELCDGVDNDCDDETDEADALDAKALFVDADRDGFGDPSSRSLACGTSVGIVEVSGDCNDDDNSIHPGAEEICDDIDQDCDDDLVGLAKDSDADALPDCIDPPYISDVAPVVLAGGAATQAGESMHIDAAGRLSIGAPIPTDGSAYVYIIDTLETGSLDSDSVSVSSPMRIPGWGSEGTTEPSGFGLQLASLPAVSGTGVDLVVAAPYDSAIISISEPDSAGPIEWPSSTGELWALEAEPPGTTTGACGTAVAGGLFSLDAGAAPSPGLVVACAGSAYVFNQDTWSDEDRLFSSIGTKIVGEFTGFGSETLEDEGFGASVASGDFNDDGIDDVAIGSDHGLCPSTGVPSRCGAVYVFMGPHDEDLEWGDADFVVNGEDRQDQLGHSLLAPGDLTGDGTEDLLVASDKESTGVEEKNGAVLLFDGHAMQDDLAYRDIGYAGEEDAHTAIHGPEPDAWFGAAMAAIPDLNGDGSIELIIGAPKVDGPNLEDGNDHGALYGFLGPWFEGTRATDANTRVVYGTQPDAELGGTVAVGDVGLDGAIDIAVAEPDDARIYVLPAADWLLD